MQIAVEDGSGSVRPGITTRKIAKLINQILIHSGVLHELKIYGHERSDLDSAPRVGVYILAYLSSCRNNGAMVACKRGRLQQNVKDCPLWDRPKTLICVGHEWRVRPR